MAMETPCQTSGAMFHTEINNLGITASVDFGKEINLTENQAEVLEANIHNALELVLAPFFMEDHYAGMTTVCRICHKPMYKSVLNQYDECSKCEKEVDFDGRDS